MTICRVQHNKEYTTVNNTICSDTRLSWKAKGIWLYAFSKPDDWTFYVSDLVNNATDGKDSVMNGLHELEKFGYLKRQRIRDNKGFLKGSEWIFYEKPQNIENSLIKKSKLKPENPNLDNPNLENPPLPSIECLLNTDINTTTLPPPKPKPKKPKSNGLVGGKNSNPFEEVSKEFPIDILSQAHKEFEEVKRKGIKVSDPVAYVRKICQRLSGIQIPSSQFEDVEINKKYAKSLEKKFYSKKGGSAHYSIAALDDKIEMVGPAGRFECLHYHMSHDTFKMLCEPWIKKLSL